MNFQEEVMKLFRKWQPANEASERTGRGYDQVMDEEGVFEAFTDLMCRMRKQYTPNGFNPQWVELINEALEARGAVNRAVDLTQEQWDTYLGPLIDEFEDYRGVGHPAEAGRMLHIRTEVKDG